jgi:hypothetical protein
LIGRGDYEVLDGVQVFNVDQVLQQIEEDDKKWGNIPLSKEDIKGEINIHLT